MYNYLVSRMPFIGTPQPPISYPLSPVSTSESAPKMSALNKAVRYRTTCDTCQSMRIKCNKGSPCGKCIQIGKACTYSPSLQGGRWINKQRQGRAIDAPQKVYPVTGLITSKQIAKSKSKENISRTRSNTRTSQMSRTISSSIDDQDRFVVDPAVYPSMARPPTSAPWLQDQVSSPPSRISSPYDSPSDYPTTHGPHSVEMEYTWSNNSWSQPTSMPNDDHLRQVTSSPSMSIHTNDAITSSPEQFTSYAAIPFNQSMFQTTRPATSGVTAPQLPVTPPPSGSRRPISAPGLDANFISDYVEDCNPFSRNTQQAMLRLQSSLPDTRHQTFQNHTPDTNTWMSNLSQLNPRMFGADYGQPFLQHEQSDVWNQIQVVRRQSMRLTPPSSSDGHVGDTSSSQGLNAITATTIADSGTNFFAEAIGDGEAVAVTNNGRESSVRPRDPSYSNLFNFGAASSESSQGFVATSSEDVQPFVVGEAQNGN